LCIREVATGGTTEVSGMSYTSKLVHKGREDDPRAAARDRSNGG
jgi:hypothetical protein